MYNEDRLSIFFRRILDSIYNVTPSHRTDLPTKPNQSLNFVIDGEETPELIGEVLSFSAVYPFIEIDPITMNTIEKWKTMGVNKPIPFQLKIEGFEEEPKYSYEKDLRKGDYTVMNFKFGSRNFSLPIERIENTYGTN